jgi:hypothetical protein
MTERLFVNSSTWRNPVSRLACLATRKPKKGCLLLALLSVMGGWTADRSRAATALTEVTSDQIQVRMDQAKQFLYSKQKSGNWEAVDEMQPGADPADIKGGQWGGLTSLATYALLAAGENPQDPRLAAAIAFLKKANMKGTYAVGLRAQVWPFLPESPERRSLVKRDCQLLVNGVRQTGKSRGFYQYVLGEQKGEEINLSASQYGVLGVWACYHAGITVPLNYWKLIEQSWIDVQDPIEGGWAPYGGRPQSPAQVTANITEAGLATLFITRNFTHANEGLDCRGHSGALPEPITKGIGCLGKHVDDVLTSTSLYGMYGLERVGVASGYTTIGTTDWFSSGASVLVHANDPSGGWFGNLGDVAETSFGLLFLAHGRAPLVFNKLRYGDIHQEPTAVKRANEPQPETASRWNNRPLDAANAVRWMGAQSERLLNWEIVDLSAPDKDLRDAPILYLSGDAPPRFSTAEEDKLRKFIYEGGLIFANSDCGSAAFTKAVHDLGLRLFPNYEWRQLALDHPIFKLEQYPASRWKRKLGILGISNGARELMILLPSADAARAWQADDFSSRPESFQFAADLYEYTNSLLSVQARGRSLWIDVDPAAHPERTIRVARLRYPGNWDPEPGGWIRLANLMASRDGISVQTAVVSLGSGQLNQPNAGVFQLAHLTGTDVVEFSPSQRADLVQFVENGGTLLVDAAGGRNEFATSASQLLQSAFPDKASQLTDAIPPQSPLYTLTGNAIANVRYRQFDSPDTNRSHQPRLRGIEFSPGKLGVIFSREDLSVGMTGSNIDGVCGYTPESATALVRNIILSSLTDKK